MKYDDLATVTNYIAIWGWQILGVTFLCSSFILFSIQKTISSQIFYIAFFLLFVFCEAQSLNKKRKLTEANEEGSESE